MITIITILYFFINSNDLPNRNIGYLILTIFSLLLNFFLCSNTSLYVQSDPSTKLNYRLSLFPRSRSPSLGRSIAWSLALPALHRFVARSFGSSLLLSPFYSNLMFYIMLYSVSYSLLSTHFYHNLNLTGEQFLSSDLNST